MSKYFMLESLDSEKIKSDISSVLNKYKWRIKMLKPATAFYLKITDSEFALPKIEDVGREGYFIRQREVYAARIALNTKLYVHGYIPRACMSRPEDANGGGATVWSTFVDGKGMECVFVKGKLVGKVEASDKIWNFDSIHSDGAAKGLDLPYADEMSAIIRELTDKTDLMPAVEVAYSLSETEMLKALKRRLNVQSPANDYYDLLIRAYSRSMLQDEVVRLQSEGKRLAKLLKGKSNG